MESAEPASVAQRRDRSWVGGTISRPPVYPDLDITLHIGDHFARPSAVLRCPVDPQHALPGFYPSLALGDLHLGTENPDFVSSLSPVHGLGGVNPYRLVQRSHGQLDFAPHQGHPRQRCEDGKQAQPPTPSEPAAQSPSPAASAWKGQRSRPASMKRDQQSASLPCKHRSLSTSRAARAQDRRSVAADYRNGAIPPQAQRLVRPQVSGACSRRIGWSSSELSWSARVGGSLHGSRQAGSS